MKTSLAKISFYNILATALIFSIVLGFFTYKITNDSYEQRVIELEQNYMQKNKELVRSEVLRIIKRIETIKTLSYNTHLSVLEEKVDFMQNMISLGYEDDLDIKSLIEKYRKQLDLFKWDNGSG